MANEKKMASKDSKEKSQAPKVEGKVNPAFINDADMSNPGTLASRLDHSVVISYDGDGMMVPPRGRVKIGNTEKLGALPSGVQLMKG